MEFMLVTGELIVLDTLQARAARARVCPASPARRFQRSSRDRREIVASGHAAQVRATEADIFSTHSIPCRCSLDLNEQPSP